MSANPTSIIYPFEADGITYTAKGTQYVNKESSFDIVSEYVVAPKYKTGDNVTLNVTLSKHGAEQLNRQDKEILFGEDEWSIASHTPAPELPFDWSTVKPGMAFETPFQGVCHFIARHPLYEDVIFLAHNLKSKSGFNNVSSFCIDNLKRAPEHDIKPDANSK